MRSPSERDILLHASINSQLVGKTNQRQLVMGLCAVEMACDLFNRPKIWCEKNSNNWRTFRINEMTRLFKECRKRTFLLHKPMNHMLVYARFIVFCGWHTRWTVKNWYIHKNPFMCIGLRIVDNFTLWQWYAGLINFLPITIRVCQIVFWNNYFLWTLFNQSYHIYTE